MLEMAVVWWNQMCCVPRFFHENLPSQLWKNEGFNGLASLKGCVFSIFDFNAMPKLLCDSTTLTYVSPKMRGALNATMVTIPITLCCWMFTVVSCHPPLKKQMSKHSSKNHQTTNHEPRQKTCQTIMK